ncbi:MAG: polysaccharide biosynthesis protein [Bacteroidales bacterium]|nr:polysaccharide biosynthesis protein [Bacteroidales bacterium]
MGDSKHSEKSEYLLITGASGFTGTFLIEKLLSETGFDLVVTGRNADRILQVNHARVHFVEIDLLHPNSFAEVFKNYHISAVFHLAALARLSEGENDPIRSIRINYIASVELIRLSIQHQVKTFVFTSSDLARHATSVVGMCKYLVEDVFRKIQEISSQFITIRLANVIDSPGAVTLIFKKQIEQGEPVTITEPDMSRRFITGPQAAEFIYHAYLFGQHNDLFVSTDKAVIITDLAQRLMHQMDKTVPIRFIGAKPGERLSEKGYSAQEVFPTSLSGLGKLRNNLYNQEETIRIQNQLLTKAKLHGDLEVIHILNELFETPEA